MTPAQVLGDAAEMEVAAYFRRMGCVVGAPWGNAPFDLFVSTELGVRRVEVKSTTQRGHVSRGGKDWGWTVVVDCSKDFDQLYVHTPDLRYLIPKMALGRTRRGITVPAVRDLPSHSQWLGYRVPR